MEYRQKIPKVYVDRKKGASVPFYMKPIFIYPFKIFKKKTGRIPLRAKFKEPAKLYFYQKQLNIDHHNKEDTVHNNKLDRYIGKRKT